MGGIADAEADGKGGCDGDEARGGIKEGGDGGGVAEGFYDSGRVGCYYAAGGGYLFLHRRR